MNSNRCGILPSVEHAIGDTPLVALDRATAAWDGRILAKLEYLNPGHSKKDRIARQMIAEAEDGGRLQPGSTVVELTSGNTGTGLALVCAVRGYHFVAVMSKGNSSERVRMMRALGAEVILVDQAPDSIPGEVSGVDLSLADAVAEKIVAERGAFRADQFSLRANVNAHYRYTAREIIDQTEGRFDAFCDFVGSGGTFAGCAAAFKEARATISCYVVEPEGAAVLAGSPIEKLRHPIQGGGYARSDLTLLERKHIDGFVQVSGAEAKEAAWHIARTEGIFAGFSTGANFAAARNLLCSDLRGATIVIMVCDSGLKYLSTNLWE